MPEEGAYGFLDKRSETAGWQKVRVRISAHFQLRFGGMHVQITYPQLSQCEFLLD